MMGSDARDMMGLPSAASPKPAQPKVPKPKIRGPTGMSREVMDLNYEGAPPISIVAPKFKEKPKLPFKPRAWDETPFGNSARKDGLILKHWRRKGDATSLGQLPVTPADSNAASEMDQDDKAQTIPDAHWAKYNVRIPRPQYSDEEYETHLKSEDWSKHETDYLVDLAIDFDLRWIVISDRYDYHPPKAPKEDENSATTTPEVKHRSQEDMKARYYAVAAKSMSLHVGVQNMSAVEFEVHEKMLKFSPGQETKRKAYVEQLLARTEEEKHEEEFLLKELSRIVINQEKLHNERKALYDRIDAPKTTQNDSYSTTMYQSSAGLTQLVQNMLSQNKQKDAQRKEKRQSGLPDEQDRHRPNQGDHNKRASIGGGGGAQAANQHRHLNPRDQARYGVTYPVGERLVGGVTFRNERAVKAAQAKSSVQTTRISAALTELGVPMRLTMPTARVVSEYERLIENVKGLLEIRKLREKVDGEVRVWQAQKEAAEARERGEEVEEKKEEPKIEEEEDDNVQEEAQKKEDSDDDEEGRGVAQNQDEDEDEEENGQTGVRQSEIGNDDEEVGEEGAEAEVDDQAGVGKEEDEEQDEDDAEAEAEADEAAVDAQMAELGNAEDGEDEAEEEEEEEEEEGGGEVEEEEEEPEAEAEAEDEEVEENDDEAGPTPTARTTRKRSASVASGISSKRQKK